MQSSEFGGKTNSP